MPVAFMTAQPVARYRRLDLQTSDIVDADRNGAQAQTYSLQTAPWVWRGDELSAGVFSIRTSDQTPEVTVDARRGTPQQITLQRITPTLGIPSTLPLVLVGTHYQATYPTLPTGLYRVTIDGLLDGNPKQTSHTLRIIGFNGLLARRTGSGIMGRSGRGILIFRMG